VSGIAGRNQQGSAAAISIASNHPDVTLIDLVPGQEVVIVVDDLPFALNVPDARVIISRTFEGMWKSQPPCISRRGYC